MIFDGKATRIYCYGKIWVIEFEECAIKVQLRHFGQTGLNLVQGIDFDHSDLSVAFVAYCYTAIFIFGKLKYFTKTAMELIFGAYFQPTLKKTSWSSLEFINVKHFPLFSIKEVIRTQFWNFSRLKWICFSEWTCFNQIEVSIC